MFPSLKDYVITQQLGSGAMGRVYLATHRHSNSQVAIKHLILDHNENQSEALIRFRREAKIIQNLTHPNIIQVHELIEEDSNFFIIMDYFPGENLKAFTATLTLEEKIQCIAQISRTLSYLHSKDIIHRDLKPQNILLQKNHSLHIKIIDFGLAYLQNLSTLFKDKEIVGSFLYISPEQTGILRRPIDNRSDLYSLGITFYELLTGAPPFTAQESGQLIYKHLAVAPPPPSALTPGIPPALDQIILKLLEKEPENRYQSSSGLADDLDFLLQNPEGKPFLLASKDFSSKINFKNKTLFRDKEIDQVSHAFTELKNHGTPAAFLCYGPSGVGKSNLLNTLKTKLLSDNTLFFDYSSSPSSTNIPFAPLKELFNFLAQKLEKSTLEEKLPPDLKNMLNEFFSPQEISSEILNTSAGQHSAPNTLKNLFTLLQILLGDSPPLVIILDDLQWLDSESFAFFSFLIKEKPLLPLLLLLSTRQEDIQYLNIPQYLKEHPFLIGLPLSLLKEDLLPVFIEKVLNQKLHFPVNFYQKLFKTTLGSPFYLLETLKKLYEKKILSLNQGSWTLDNKAFSNLELSDQANSFELFSLNSFSPQELEILSVAALIGQNFTLSLLETMCAYYFKQNQPDLNTLMQIIDKARSRLILDELVLGNEICYDFVHEKIRETFENYNQRKADMHLACASYLENESKQNLSTAIFQLAYHYSQTEDLEKKLFYNQQAFQLASSQSATHIVLYYLEQIINYYNSIIPLPTQAIPYYIAYGHYLQVNGRIKESFSPLENALEVTKKRDLQDFSIQILLEIGTGYYYLNEINLSLDYYEQAFAIAKNSGQEITLGYPYYLMGSNFWFVSKLHEAESYLTKAICYMDENDWDNKLPALAMRSATYIMLGEIDKAFQDVKTMENNFSQTRNTVILPHAYHCCSLCYSWGQKNFHKGLDYAFEAYEIAHKNDNLIFEYSSLFSRALAFFYLQNFSKAQEAIQAGIKLSREKNIFVGIYLLYAYEVETYLWNGQLEKVLSLCEKYLVDHTQVVEKLPVMLLLRAKALAHYARQEFTEAISSLEEAATIFSQTDIALIGITIPYLQHHLFHKIDQKNQSSGYLQQVEQLLVKMPELQNQLTHVKSLLHQIEKLKKEKDSYHLSSFTLKENFQLENIIKTSQKLSSILDIDKLLTMILEKTLEVTGAERGALILLKNNNQPEFFVFLKSTGETTAFPVPEEIISLTLSRQKGVICDTAQPLPIDQKNPLYQEIKSIICAPLIIKETIIGLLYLDSQLIHNLFSLEELKLLNVFTSQAAISIENAQLHSKMLRQVEIEKEIEVAKDIQISLLPDTQNIDGFEISAFMQSAEEVGGDYYDFYLDAPPYFGIFGDVSGHGLKSGLIMMMAEVAFNTIMTSQTSREASLPQLYQQLNAVLHKNIQKRLSIKSKAAKEYSYMYMTCKIFRFDPAGNFEIFGADYSSPFICKAQTGEIIELESKGFLLGILDDATMGKEAVSFSLEQDDLLVLYSDGITEAKKYSKDVILREKVKNYLFGTEKLYQIIQKNRYLNPEEIIAVIMKEVQHWMHTQEDDIAITIIKKK